MSTQTTPAIDDNLPRMSFFIPLEILSFRQD